MSRFYVYAVTGSPIETFTDGEHTLESVQIDGLHVIVDRSGLSLPASEEALRRQHRIVERIAERADAVLPARFGTVVDVEEARRVLGSRRHAIEEALTLVTARRQMTVRFRARQGEPQPETAPVAAAGTAYLHSRRAAAAGTLPGGELARFRAAVRDLVAAERIRAGRETIMSTVYHLVERSRTAEYRQRAMAAGEDLVAATVTVTGPWPAFAFAPEWL